MCLYSVFCSVAPTVCWVQLRSGSCDRVGPARLPVTKTEHVTYIYTSVGGGVRSDGETINSRPTRIDGCGRVRSLPKERETGGVLRHYLPGCLAAFDWTTRRPSSSFTARQSRRVRLLHASSPAVGCGSERRRTACTVVQVQQPDRYLYRTIGLTC
jgi:hypothetical protein